MRNPLLLIVVGARAELLALSPLLRVLQGIDPASLGFRWQLLSTGQERTELDQTMDALGFEANPDLGLKSPHVLDVAINALMLTEMESAMRHLTPSTVLIAGASASAWAAATVAHFKSIPLIWLGAGRLPRPGTHPFPEWFHLGDIMRLADVHLCPDQAACEAIRRQGWFQEIGDRPPRVELTGDPWREALAHALAHPPEAPDDPTLGGLDPDTPRVLLFLRRREHHADALRPFCDAMGALSARFDGSGPPRHDFVVVYSLQAHICDALVAQLPHRENLRGISPLPHNAFVSQLARARLVVTDSTATAWEAAWLGRPTLIVGEYSVMPPFGTPDDDGDKADEAPLFVAPMARDALVGAIGGMLEEAPPPPAPKRLRGADAGGRSMDAVRDWMDGLGERR